MALQIRTTYPESTSVTFFLDGQLDAVTAPGLEQTFLDALKPDTQTLVLDLSKLTFISSAGLRIFAKMRKQMVAREGKLCFVNLSPQVQKVFDIVKAVPNSEVFRDMAELDSYLAVMQQKVTERQRG